jgi:hypothetical protein
VSKKHRGIEPTTALAESDLWKVQSATAKKALGFVIDFLGCRMNGSDGELLNDTAADRLLTIVRAVSLVESRHGTAGKSQPKRDPLQCGNPNDAWWKEFTGQLGTGSRFIRHPTYKQNYWANEVGDGAEKAASFPAVAKRSLLGTPGDGHKNTAFAPAHSYVWGILYLLHRINHAAGDPSYQCGDLSRDRLIDGAVSYNAGGVTDYRDRIVAALAEFGDPLAAALPAARSKQTELLAEVLAVVKRSGGVASRLQVTYQDAGTLASVTIDLSEDRSDLIAAKGTSDELAIGQKVPNDSELNVCGAIDKKIRRTDPEFATLIKNTSASIAFKDEEGTGADRMMSQRLVSGLDRLALLVTSEWPSAKLRVTEAWDENNEHSGDSLHYEARAADITTSPVDGNKLGRLGRLAVDAGLDWVFFENSAHVHVSVRK